MPQTHFTFAKKMSEITGVPYKRKQAVDTRKGRGRGNRHVSTFDRAHFIAWDGEGISIPSQAPIETPTGRTEYQAYALLMNNEGTLVVDVDGISTALCLETLLTSTDDKHAIHVVFGGSYDMNMMLRNVPVRDLKRLHAGDNIDYDKYQISYRPRKALEIREYRDPAHKKVFDEKRNTWRADFSRSMTLWDVYSFFGDTFVSTLCKYFNVKRVESDAAGYTYVASGAGNHATSERYVSIINAIEYGKQLRGTFTEAELKSLVMPYCKLEVHALHELMVTLQGYLKEAGMTLARWDGAGACAASLMQKYSVKDHLTERDTPKEVTQAAEFAYFGGRIETLKFGNYENTVHHYDINSAYPAAMLDLPSMQGGNWKHYDGPINRSFAKSMNRVTIYRVAWRMDEFATICPFPWRARKTNSVYFPPRGAGWIWKPELDMCIDNFHDSVELYIAECWEFWPSNHQPMPFLFIQELYDKRKEMVLQQNGGEKVLKLGLNSLYGKTAQSLGYNKRTNSKPPYHNLVIAGMITSIVRAKVTQAAMQAPNHVIMIATDGIYSTTELFLECPKEKILGKWEYSTHEYMTIVASGVYWTKSKGSKENPYSRGFDKFSILREKVLQAWTDGKSTLPCKSTRFVGIGSAIGLNDFNAWCSWRTIYRDLDLTMTSVVKRQRKNHNNPAAGLVDTRAALHDVIGIMTDDLSVMQYMTCANAMFIMSSKYKFDWDVNTRAGYLDGIPGREYAAEQYNASA